MKAAKKREDEKESEAARIELAVEERFAKYKTEFQRSEAKRIRGNGHSSLTPETIAQRMAHVEYLHKYRRTEYQAAVDHEARIYGYKKAVRIVQGKPDFAPPNVFPWMKE